MIRDMRIPAFLLALMFASPAIAQTGSLDLGDRRLDAIDDPVKIEFRSGGTAPGIERIGQAAEKVGVRLDWEVKPKGAGLWELTRDVADKHRATVTLLCDAAGCAINYVDSLNLRYRDRKQSGALVRAIHQNYNLWIRELATGLAKAVGGPARITYGFAPLADAEAVPHVRDAGRKAYQDFLVRPKPRAFAIAENGAWGAAAPAQGTYAATRYFDSVRLAMERCENRGAGTCRLYAVDDRVVWDPTR
jgi:hypothetical protein